MQPASLPSADDHIDLDRLLRDAIFGIAVQAYSRGIGISTHVDTRLPTRIQGNATALSEFLKLGLARTVAAGGTNTLAVALWFDKIRPEDQGPRILLEVCRAFRGGERPSTSLSDLWALPIGDETARPVCARQPDAGEAVMIALPCAADSGAAPMAANWIGAFRDRYLLVVPGAIFDSEKSEASFAAVGLERVAASAPDRALAIAKARVMAGHSVDFLVLEGQSLGGAAIDLAKAFRADPGLSKTQIVLTGNARDFDLPSDDAALFDVVQQVNLPWRRLMQLLFEISGGGARTPARRQQAAQRPDSIPSLAGRRILVAEDVETNQMLLQTVLAPTGAKVEVVADGAAVVRRQAETPADLILMDLQMPGMGGIEAMRRLRALGGAAAKAPVMALTAYARSADRKVAIDAGMDAFLAKPIVVAELYDLLRQLLPEK